MAGDDLGDGGDVPPKFPLQKIELENKQGQRGDTERRSAGRQDDEPHLALDRKAANAALHIAGVSLLWLCVRSRFSAFADASAPFAIHPVIHTSANQRALAKAEAAPRLPTIREVERRARGKLGLVASQAGIGFWPRQRDLPT
jgi:hypothetical protein